MVGWAEQNAPLLVSTTERVAYVRSVGLLAANLGALMAGAIAGPWCFFGLTYPKRSPYSFEPFGGFGSASGKPPKIYLQQNQLPEFVYAVPAPLPQAPLRFSVEPPIIESILLPSRPQNHRNSYTPASRA